MSLEEMLLRNELERLEPSAGEIDRLLGAIARRLEDARNLSIHAETRLLAGLSRHPQLCAGCPSCKQLAPCKRPRQALLRVGITSPYPGSGTETGRLLPGATRSAQ